MSTLERIWLFPVEHWGVTALVFWALFCAIAAARRMTRQVEALARERAADASLYEYNATLAKCWDDAEAERARQARRQRCRASRRYFVENQALYRQVRKIREAQSLQIAADSGR